MKETTIPRKSLKIDDSTEVTVPTSRLNAGPVMGYTTARLLAEAGRDRKLLRDTLSELVLFVQSAQALGAFSGPAVQAHIAVAQAALKETDRVS